MKMMLLQNNYLTSIVIDLLHFIIQSICLTFSINFRFRAMSNEQF